MSIGCGYARTLGKSGYQEASTTDLLGEDNNVVRSMRKTSNFWSWPATNSDMRLHIVVFAFALFVAACAASPLALNNPPHVNTFKACASPTITFKNGEKVHNALPPLTFCNTCRRYRDQELTKLFLLPICPQSTSGATSAASTTFLKRATSTSLSAPTPNIHTAFPHYIYGANQVLRQLLGRWHCLCPL
jgi:hypothetical protein